MFRQTSILVAILALLAPAGHAQTTQAGDGTGDMSAPAADESWLPSLQTDTPEQGFDLAISMARRAVKTTQPDVEVLKSERGDYATDGDSLIEVSGVAATWFATIAAANDYWRD